MKKITKLEELKKLDKAQLLDEMLKGTIKGGSSCGSTPPPPPGMGPGDGRWSDPAQTQFDFF